MEISKLIDSMLNAPIENLVAVAVIIVAMVFWTALKKFSKDQFYQMKHYLISGKENKKIKELQYHDIFRSISDVRVKTDKAKFHTDGELDVTKGRMFSDFMNFKLDAVNKAFLNVIDRAADARSDEHLMNMIIDAVRDSVKEYMLKTENHFLRKGIELKDANYAINIFEEWRAETITSVRNEIKNIFASEFHKGKYQKLLAVLQIISMAVSLIPKDGMMAFNSMNGKFKTIKYKK